MVVLWGGVVSDGRGNPAGEENFEEERVLQALASPAFQSFPVVRSVEIFGHFLVQRFPSSERENAAQVLQVL